jgi:plastocyanin
VSGGAKARALLALLGAAILAIAIGSTATGAPAPKEGCAWHRHAKRVVKHVRRHGKVHRVARVRHWWTCDPKPGAPPPGPPAGGTPEEPTAPVVSHLGVKAVEWSYTLSRPELSAGEVIVELNNQGEDNHNLKLVREGGGEPPLEVEEAAPEGHTSGRFTLAPGTYRLYCSLFQHDEKGMHANLLVTGP